MKITDTEWYYDKKFDKSCLDRIEAALLQPTLDWIDSNETDLRAHLDKHPKQMIAGTAEGASFFLDAKEIFLLRLLMIRRDEPDPYQCQIYAGSKEFILRNKDSIQKQFSQAMQQPGTDGVMIEQNL